MDFESISFTSLDTAARRPILTRAAGASLEREMCGRYTLTNPDPAKLRVRFDVSESVEVEDEPRFNIAPTDPVLAVRRREDATRELGRLRWGLIPGRWAEKGGRPLINARAETLESQPAFRESFEERRCLIPADGFYEWLEDEQGKRPVWVSRPDGELFAFAGLWAGLPERSGDGVTHSCTIVTCEPNELIRPIHDRMPVVLAPDVEGDWLAPEAEVDDLRGLLVPAPEDLLVVREVGDFVNDVRDDGPHLIEPREEQKSLF
jgi:putative SOS response-associated peptidase YedK